MTEAKASAQGDKNKTEEEKKDVTASTSASPAKEEAPSTSQGDNGSGSESAVSSQASASAISTSTDAAKNGSYQSEADSLETEQVVVFKLENEEYAAPILEVQEIIPTGDITPFPNVPEYIAGIINIRGSVATVINLSKRFNIARNQSEGMDKYIILTNSGKSLFGIMVDEVTSVMKIPKNKIRSAAGMSESKINDEYVNNVAVFDDRVILILDFQKILDEESLSIVAGQAEEAAK